MNQENPSSAIPSWDEIRQIIRETSIQMKETDRLIKETGLQMKETDRKMQETDRLIKETGLQMKETDRRMQETDRRMQETDRMTKEFKEGLKETRALLDDIARRSDKRIKELNNLFSTQWGRLIESLSTPAALKLFKDLDIGINRVYSGKRKIKDNGIDRIELDIVLCNTTVAIVVEVKTTFRKSDVSEFLKKMKNVKKYFPEFADKQLYAATAAIKYDESSDTIAQKAGMFVIHTSGDGVFSLTQPKKRETF